MLVGFVAISNRGNKIVISKRKIKFIVENISNKTKMKVLKKIDVKQIQTVE